jgi:hypothetical protein
VNSGDGEQKKKKEEKKGREADLAATHGGRTQLLVAVAAFPTSGSSSFLLCLSVFLLLLLLFCRFSISSSIPVDDGVAVAADDGMAVRVADRPCSALYFFFFFRLCFFSSSFFWSFPAALFLCSLFPCIYRKKKQGGRGLLPLPSHGARVGWSGQPLCNRPITAQGVRPLCFFTTW